VRGIVIPGGRRVARRVAMVGVVVMAAGGTLVGTAVSAWATTPSISFTQTAPIGPTSDLPTTVTGTGFHHSSVGALFECSTASGQPTIDATSTPGIKTSDLGKLPVSCGQETPVITTAKGDLPATAIVGLEEGVVGPPTTGPDSTGGDAATDAGNYPCPPSAAQSSAQCVVMYVDAAGDTASAPITFASPTTATTGPTSCVGQANSTTAGSATLTVTPATCLVGGQLVQITGSGLATSSEGTLLECNSDASQPVLSLGGQTIPVSCSSLDVVTTTATGGFTAKAGEFTIQTGTTGPPLAGTDSTGGNDATDAVNYPCPPTAAQIAAGDSCEIVLRDAGGDDLTVPISFNAGGGGSSTTKSASTPTGGKVAATASTGATKASSHSLAFTGPGPLLWIAGLLGIIFLVLGASLLLVVDDSRRPLTVAHRWHRRFTERS
jgi:hypothetical protein